MSSRKKKLSKVNNLRWYKVTNGKVVKERKTWSKHEKQ